MMKTTEIYHLLEQANLTLDLLQKIQQILVIPCEVTDEDLLALSAIAAHVEQVKEEVECRYLRLNRELTLLLESQLP